MLDDEQSAYSGQLEPSSLPSKSSRARKSSPTTDTASAPNRKRSKASDNGVDDEEKKRSRGRPRLDTRDETAADRRRTQIRLAQRAYRQRKDTAITTLEQKVRDLEQVNSDMGKEFMNFYDYVLSQGMLNNAPEVARRLNDTTRKFLSLARKATEDDSRDAEDNSASGSADSSADVERKNSNQSIRTSHSSEASSAAAHSSGLGSSRDQSSVNTVSSSPPTASFTSFDQYQKQPYEIITQPTPENASFPVYGMPGEANAFNNSLFAPSPFNSLELPNTYSHQERTFGRRLQRLTLEAGLRLVSMANPPPDRYAAVFGFCLLFESKEAIKTRLATSLHAPTDETLFYWRYPFTNLGGAGLNFPGEKQSNSQGNMAGFEMPIGNQGLRQPYKPQDMTGFSIGPFGPEIEATRDERVDYRLRMVFDGFEGQFLDADEIDHYLQQRGLFIPEYADYVDAEININEFQSAANESSSAPSSVPQANNLRVPTSNAPYSVLSSTSFDPVANMWSGTSQPPTMQPFGQQMHAPLGDASAASAGAVPFNHGPRHYEGAQMFSQEGWGMNSYWGKTKVTVDVARLLTELITRTVCLGRTPGIRVRDVDRAVKLAAGISQAAPRVLAVEQEPDAE